MSAKRSFGAARAQLANARAQRQFFAENKSPMRNLAPKAYSAKKNAWIGSRPIHRLRDRHHIFNIDYALVRTKKNDHVVSNVAAYASK